MAKSKAEKKPAAKAPKAKADGKSVKTTTKAGAKSPARPAAAKGIKSTPPPRPKAPVPMQKAPPPKDGKSASGMKENPEAGQVRAHPDAKLSPKEVQSLFQKLVDEKTRVVSGFDRHVQEALSDDDVLADEIDIAQRSTDQAWLFKFADKERKLLIEIDAALEKMRGGEYGLCEGTDEPIGFKRLELRPWTRYSVAYKEMLEREKAQQAR
jgi:DnaK suppressor protein